MSLLTLSAKLDRSDPQTSWGFRMYGGKDFGSPLSIQRITPGSLAEKCGLQEGDIITKIGEAPTEYMRHKEAQQKILMSGNSLELALERGARGSRGQRGYTSVQAPQQPYVPPAHAPPPPAPGQSYGGQGTANGWTPHKPASSYNEDYNRAAAPFSPGGSPMSQQHVPVAVNKQYNTPINMYSMDNVMESLVTQTNAISVGPTDGGGGGGRDAIPPWQSGGGGGGPSPRAAPVAPPAPPAPIGGSGSVVGGVWKPKIPTGPRKIRAVRPTEVKSMPAMTTGRIPVCNGCGTAIRGPFVAALDKTWCPDHFICSNPQCQCHLIGVGFVEEEGQLFCERDFEQYLAPRCGKCGRAIIRECVNALKDTFHPECFLCAQCGQSAGTGAFHLEDGQIYCEKDWQARFQTKCYGCQFPIEPGDRWVEALSQNWHSECFNCSTCQVNLEGQSFFAKGGKPYCKKHASSRQF